MFTWKYWFSLIHPNSVFDLLNLDVAFFLPGEDVLKLDADALRLNEAEDRPRFRAHTLQTHIAVRFQCPMFFDLLT